MSPFGVIELTRQRVRPSIKNYTYVTCPTCAGFGMVRSAETMCLSLLRRMKVALIEERVVELAVQVHPHVLSHLHSEFRDDIDDLEDTFEKRIVFEYAKDLILGQTRFFYVNDRGVRVLYDMDQRINSFAGSGPKVKSNVPLPPTAVGAGPTITAPGERKGRRRRGGRRQREREQERMQREQRIKTDATRAVTFGDTLPEARVEVIKQEPQAPQQPGKPGEPGKGRRRGRRGGRRQREREAGKGRGPDTGRPAEAVPAQTPPSPGREAEGPRQAAPAPATTPTPQPTAEPQPANETAKATRGRRGAAKKPAIARPAKAGDGAKRAPAKKKATARKPAAKKAPAKRKPAARKKPE
jgi:ribonuclease E